MLSRDRRPFHRAAREFLDPRQQAVLFGRGEARRAAAGLRARGAADAMHVILGHMGHVEVDHVADLGDVDATRRDVGGDEDAMFAAAEPFERLAPLRLRAVGMDDRHLVAAPRERLGHPVRAPLGSGENERGQLVLLEEREQQRDLLLLADEEHLLRRALGGGPDAGHLDADRMV